MGLDDLNEDITAEYSDLDDEIAVDLDRETKNELAMLAAAFETDDPAELLRRGVHALYRQTVDTGDLDFHLRSAYDVTYDEYLYATSNNTNTEEGNPPPADSGRDRYRF